MPAIKLKKVTAEYLAEKEKENEKLKLAKAKINVEEEEDEEQSESGEENKPEEKAHNFLDVKVLWEKRKRSLPVDEQKLIDWLDSNLEKKEDVYLPSQQLYEFYCAMCQAQGQETKVVDIPIFNKYIRGKFGKFFGFQDNSPYKVLLKEKKTKGKKNKEQGDIQPIKMRDIVTEVINDIGNPRIGVRYSHISKAIMRKYPAQRVDIYPKKLKWALERDVALGYLERVRGVGMCGLYRVRGEPTPEELEREKKKKMGKQTKEQGEQNEGEGKEEEEAEGDKAEKTEGSGEDGAEEEKKSEEEDEASDPLPKKQKPKKKKVSKIVEISASRHSDPKTVEDALPMAITYQSEPKEASGMKIKKYIDRFYNTDIHQDRLRKALDHGVDKGLWERVRGIGIQGVYHLLTQTFMPSSSDDIYDQIAQSIVAYNEPKQASSLLIKKYISQYHPKLNVDNRPKHYRNCLERAADKRIIRQLSGIGATGTFQLLKQFIPSPAILAGESDDEEEEVHATDVYDEKPEYIPRKTKHGRLAIRVKSQASAGSTAGSRQKQRPPQSKQKGKSSAGRRTSGKSKQYVESSDEDDYEEKPKPKPSKSRGGAAKKVSNKKQPSKPSTPAKSPSKKTATSQKKSADKKSVEKSSNDSSSVSARKRGKLSYSEQSDDEAEDDIAEMKGKSSRGKKVASAKGRKREKINYDEKSYDDDGTDDVIPGSKAAKGRKNSAAADVPSSDSRKRGRVNYTEQSDGEEEEEEEKKDDKSSVAKKAAKQVGKKSPKKRQEADVDEGREPTSPPVSESRKRGRVNYMEQSDEDGEDEEEAVAAKKAMKQEGKKSAKRKLDVESDTEEQAPSPFKKKAAMEYSSSSKNKAKHKR